LESREVFQIFSQAYKITDVPYHLFYKTSFSNIKKYCEDNKISIETLNKQVANYALSLLSTTTINNEEVNKHFSCIPLLIAIFYS